MRVTHTVRHIRLILGNYLRKVRWLKVRGLGLDQQIKLFLTVFKILSHLDLMPLTYEQLHNLTSIHRNILRKRLEELVEDKMIIKYKFRLPYDKFYYGYTYRHHLCPDPPTARTYYLLNFSKYDQILSGLCTYRVFMIKQNYRIRHHDFPDFNKLPIETSKQDIDTESTFPDLKNIGDYYIALCYNTRKIDLLRLRKCYENRPENKGSDKRWEGLKTQLLSYADFVTKRARCGIGEIIIKCCHQPTVIVGDGLMFEKDSFLLLPIFQYMDIISLLLETNYQRELRKIFV
jgi:DNA-binding Lrp family transcriptional regulator